MAEHEQGVWGERRSGVAAGWGDAPPPVHRRGFEWGLASLLVGATCLLMSPLALLVWASVIQVHDLRWSRHDVSIICTGLIITEFGVLVLVLLGLAFGVTGIVAARSQGAPQALPVAAVAVGVVSLCFWIGIMVSSFNTTSGLLR
jgi:hypothetical protein